MKTPPVTMNIRRGKAPVRQRQAWNEFLDMLQERAEAEAEKEKDAAAQAKRR